MNNILNIAKRYFDPFLFGPMFFLIVIGLLVQYSIATKTTGPSIAISMPSQVLGLSAGVVLGIGLSFIEFDAIKRHATKFALIAALLLIIVLVFGIEANGAQRWVSLVGIRIQPSEIAKIAVIFVTARHFSVGRLRSNKLMTLLQSLVYVGVFAGLVLLQPDLGSAIVFIVIWASVLFNSKIKLGRFSLVIVGLMASTLVLTPFLAEYQQERLISYFNTSQDSSGANYNVEQAKIAIGNGRLTGNGLDGGSQSTLNFLPSQHTDFIFAVTTEKLGLLGAVLVIAAFTTLYARMMHIAWHLENEFYSLMIVGVTAMLFFHTFINIGMNVGIVPVTGLPLPFLSFGGTFALVSMFCVLLVNRIRVISL